MTKSFLGIVGLFCLVACGSSAAAGGADPAPSSDVPPPGAAAGVDPAAASGQSPAALGAPVVKAVADDGAVKLTWAAIEGATSYEVARATSSGAEVMLTTVSAAELVDTGVEAETTYFYKVTPKSAAASGAASAEVSATPFSFDKLHMRHNAQVLRGVAEGAGVLVAVGDGMRVMRSTDGGTTWNDASVPGYGSLNAVSFGAGTFVAVGSRGQIFTSKDAIVWQSQSSGATTTLNGVAFGGKGASARFVAIGDGSTVLSSADGITWKAVATNLHHTQGSAFDYKLRSISYGDAATLDYFVLTASDGNGNGGYAFYLKADTDLATWTPSPAGSMGFLLGAPIYGSAFGKYVGAAGAVPSFHLVGMLGFWAHVEETAPGTLTFATVNAGTAADTWGAVAFDGADTLAVFGQSGKVMSCSISKGCKFGANGWALESTPPASGMWAATQAAGKIVGVGSDELVFGKTAGAAVTELHRSSPSFTHLLTRTVASVGDNVVVSGTFGGRYLHSSDGGLHFASVAAPNQNGLWGAKAIGGKLYMVGDKSTIMSSDTGATGTWDVASTSPTTDSLRAIASSGALTIAAGSNGLFTSPDGKTWTHQVGAGHGIMSLEWEGTTFVATTSDGHILTTTDGVTFKDALFDQAQGMSLEGLSIVGGTIVVTGREGHVWMSTDHGASFQPHHIAEAPALVGLAYANGKWIAAGSGAERSELWTSANGIDWQRRTAIPPTAYGVSFAAGKVFVAGQFGALYSTPAL